MKHYLATPSPMFSDGIYSALLQNVINWKRENNDKPLLLFVPNNLLKALAKKLLEGEIQEGFEVRTIPEFMRENRKLQTPHPMTLIWRLYGIHKTITSTPRDFSLFVSWGLQILTDFDEIDRYLLDPRLVFFNLSEYHRLESLRGSLSEKVVNILKKFWKEIEDKKSFEGRSRFLDYWQHLAQLYEKLRAHTLEKKEAWDGLAMRIALESEKRLMEGMMEKTVAFAGFSIVSPAEERFMSLTRETTSAAFFYDIHPDYLLPEKGALAEHGESLKRLMQKFPPASEEKFLPSSLQRLILQGFMGKEAMIQAVVQDIRNSKKPLLVVTPSQETVQRLKATLGTLPDGYIPITDFGKDGDVVGFCSLLSELHENYSLQQGYVNLNTLLKLLSHPFLLIYCDGFENLSEKLIQKLKETDAYYPLLKSEFLKTSFQEISPLLQGIESASLQGYFLMVFTSLKAKEEYKEIFAEIKNFFQALSVLTEEMSDHRALMKLIQTWLRLEPIRSTELPNQLRLLVTGLLDSRALDCDEVYFIDFNDNVFPDTENKPSVIPYSLRLAFGLPVIDHAIAEQFYLFFRLTQRCKTFHMLYDAQPGENHGGEPSLLLGLLKATLPSSLYVESKPLKLPSPIIPAEEDITVEKSPYVLEKLKQLLCEDSGLSATALNTYLTCPLRFYFRYVAGLTEPRDLSVWHPANFGTLFHAVMEKLYAPLVGQPHQWLKTEDVEVLKESLTDLVKASIAIMETGLLEKNYTLKGKNILLEHMLIKAVNALLEADKKRVPFRILATEKNLEATLATEHGNVKFRGKVDRVDETSDSLLLLDYKTGGFSWKQFDPSFLEDIFDEKKRSDYDVQIALYAWLLYQEFQGKNHKQISAHVYEVRSLIAGDDENLKVSEPEPMNGYFLRLENQLKRVVSSILSSETPFHQTSNVKICSTCPYNSICRKG